MASLSVITKNSYDWKQDPEGLSLGFVICKMIMLHKYDYVYRIIFSNSGNLFNYQYLKLLSHKHGNMV